MSNAAVQLATRESIRDHYGAPNPRVLAKEFSTLDVYAKRFIEISPFVVIASADEHGRCDSTPRGDAPGFVAILDEKTLLIPDRPGNRRVDTMLNVTANPHVGLLFIVPGINETLRVNGRAHYTQEESLLLPLSANGKPPLAGLILATEEVFFHCGKALMRSHLWNSDAQVDRSAFPSLGRILAEQIKDTTVAESERFIEESYTQRLY